MAKKTTTEAPPIEFKLIHVGVLDFAFNQIKKEFDPNSFPVGYHIDPKIGINIPMSHITVTLIITATIIPTKESFLKTTSLFVFEIAKINDIAEIGQNNTVAFKNIKDKKPFLASLIGISYSTMRGIIMEKGSGTILQSNFLPLIDPNTFIKDQI